MSVGLKGMSVKASRSCWRSLAAALLISQLVGCGGGPPAGPPRQAGPVEVTVAKPLVLATLDWAPYTGRLSPIESVDIRARVSGYLVSHHFEEGQLVEKGQLLFVIDERPYQATVSQARASREEAVAKRQQAIAEIDTAKARKQQAIAAIDLANAQLRRAEPLVPSGAISRDEYDEYINAAKQAEADSLASDAGIQAAQAAASAAEAAIITAEAELTAAELDLSYCRIAAPISGRISRRMVTEGNLISGGLGATAMTTIVSVDPIHADFDANEQALLKYIRMNQETHRTNSRVVKTPVYMKLMDEEGYPHQGYIDFVDNQVDRTTGSIRGRAIFSNEDRTLIPGVFVKVQIPGNSATERVLIPDSAIATDQASKFVFVVGKDRKIANMPVKTGPLSKGLRVIVEGLEGNEAVVINGLQRCRPGLEAKPTVGEIVAEEGDGLPDTYEPVPPEKWLMPAVAPAPVASGGAGE